MGEITGYSYGIDANDPPWQGVVPESTSNVDMLLSPASDAPLGNAHSGQLTGPMSGEARPSMIVAASHSNYFGDGQIGDGMGPGMLEDPWNVDGGNRPPTYSYHAHNSFIGAPQQRPPISGRQSTIGRQQNPGSRTGHSPELMIGMQSHSDAGGLNANSSAQANPPLFVTTHPSSSPHHGSYSHGLSQPARVGMGNMQSRHPSMLPPAQLGPSSETLSMDCSSQAIAHPYSLPGRSGVAQAGVQGHPASVPCFCSCYGPGGEPSCSVPRWASKVLVLQSLRPAHNPTVWC